ncbi:MAG: hypothetical protein ACD_21C00020G0001 [uncultured bacterium]|nr:MAG: hypothetical protein ACD_21C00020G0001 [uncultured bacterium]
MTHCWCLVGLNNKLYNLVVKQRSVCIRGDIVLWRYETGCRMRAHMEVLFTASIKQYRRAVHEVSAGHVANLL